VKVKLPKKTINPCMHLLRKSRSAISLKCFKMFRSIKILRHAPEKGKVGSEAGQGSRFVDGLLAIGAL
jgi:hypothetical protein